MGSRFVCFLVGQTNHWGTGNETYGMGSVFPHDDLWIGLDTYTNCILICDLLLKSDWWGVPFVLSVLTDWGKGWLMVACPFRALVVLYWMLTIFTWYEMFNLWVTVSIIVQLIRMFPHTDFLFWLDWFNWTSFHGSPLYHIYILCSG